MDSKLVLASGSVFRKKLLAQLAVEFDVASPKISERAIESEFEGPIQQLAEHLAVKKAESLRSQYPNRPIIGSDQVLILDGKTLNKPESLFEVKQRLQLLQGKGHQLLTGLCLLTSGQVYKTTVEARLTMYPLSEKEIDAYVQLDQAVGCAGGYKIEAGGALLFQKITTEDYSSIIGLPLLSLVAFLRQEGILGP